MSSPLPTNRPVPNRPTENSNRQSTRHRDGRRLRWRHVIGAVVMLFAADAALGQFSAPTAPAGPGETASVEANNRPASGLIEARPGRDVAASGDLIGFSSISDGGQQTITLINTRKLWMAVYHVNAEGSIQLVSSRPIDADFSLELNVTDPKPSAIRDLQ